MKTLDLGVQTLPITWAHLMKIGILVPVKYVIMSSEWTGMEGLACNQW